MLSIPEAVNHFEAVSARWPAGGIGPQPGNVLAMSVAVFIAQLANEEAELRPLAHPLGSDSLASGPGCRDLDRADSFSLFVSSKFRYTGLQVNGVKCGFLYCRAAQGVSCLQVREAVPEGGAGDAIQR